MSNKCLPDSLKGKPHNDWFWPLSYVPRSWTARCGWAWPQPPKLLLGNSGWENDDYHNFVGHYSREEFEARRHILPIPKEGHFLLTAVLWLKFIPLPMFNWNFKGKGYISLGIVRWDDVDEYYDLMRIRASRWRGRVALTVILLGLASLLYFIIF